MAAYNRFWQWAEKAPESLLTIPAEFDHVMTLCQAFLLARSHVAHLIRTSNHT
jgi:hypothetical protein